ncbi:MAG: hypothetical protein L0Z55_03820 [Planctomycetes bacterium]|nr:hypothetical protein [Planctomycetota bacterium]
MKNLDRIAMIGAAIFILAWVAGVYLFAASDGDDPVAKITEYSQTIEAKTKNQVVARTEAPKFAERVRESFAAGQATDFEPWSMERVPGVALLFEPVQKAIPEHPKSHLVRLGQGRDAEKRCATHELKGKFGKWKHIVIEECVLEARKGEGQWTVIRKLENPQPGADFEVLFRDLEESATYSYRVRTTARAAGESVLPENDKSQTSDAIGPYAVPPSETWEITTIHSIELDPVTGEAKQRRAQLVRKWYDYDKASVERKLGMVEETWDPNNPDLWKTGSPVLGTSLLVHRIHDDRVELRDPTSERKVTVKKGVKAPSLALDPITLPIPDAVEAPGAGVTPSSADPQKATPDAPPPGFKDDK